MRKLLPSYSVILLLIIFGVILSVMIGYLFRSNFHDYMQHESDAAYFFEAASAGDFEFEIDSNFIRNIIEKENILPLAIYGWIYSFFNGIGVARNPFFGIALNASMVALSQLIVVLYARRDFKLIAKSLSRLHY